MIDPSSSEEDSEDEHKKQPAKLPGKYFTRSPTFPEL